MSETNTTPRRTRVLVVDDSAFMRTALARMISNEPDLEVVASACNGSDALVKVVALDPDVITLDVSMPGLDGLNTLRWIMDHRPRPVIMVSATTEEDADITLSALSMGAFDYVPKRLSPNTLEIMHIRSDLLSKIRAAAQPSAYHQYSSVSRKAPRSVDVQPEVAQLTKPAIVAIGVSTGGPRALEEILPRFPRGFAIPILIVQHMPVGFTRPLAQRLNSICSLSVREATQHERVQPGVAYIAPAGLHMRVVRGLSNTNPMLLLDSHSMNALHIPSIDVLMKSVAEVFRNRAIGVIMTGMGSDGAKGMASIFQQGGFTLGQDQSTCAVYGMPRVCAELGILTRIVPLSNIPTQIIGATRHHALHDPPSSQICGR